MARNLDASVIPKGWKYELLDTFVERRSGHTPNKSHPEYWNGGIKWISLTDTSKLDKGYVFETEKNISFKGVENSSAEIHPAETVVLSRDAGVGKSGVMAEPMAVSQHFIAWRCDNQEKMHSWFLYNWLQLYKKEIERQAVGSTIKTIGLPYFKKLKITLPSFAEQSEIVSIISTWDKATSNTEKLLAGCYQQKKVLIRQLLSGRVRLIGDEVAWSDVAFSDVVSLSQEKFNPKVESDTRDCVELEHISQKTSQLIGLTTTHEAVSTKTVFKKGSVLFGKLRPYLRKYWLADQAGVCSTEIWVFNANVEKCIPDYIHQLVQTDLFIDASNISSGTHMPRADWNVVKDLVVSLPPISEQKKIAEVLTVADKEIQALQQKLTHLKQEKKALMQQLLTGKKRVKLDNATIPTTP